MEKQRVAKVYIVDDDPNAITLLSRLLQDYSVNIIGATGNLEVARNEILDRQPDLLFLDVEMPAGTGLEFWTQLQPLVKDNLKVVFYTGYDKYILDALRRQAFDYMLKPATASELAKIMTRFYEQKLISVQAGPTPRQNIMILNPIGEYMVLQFDDIAYFRFNAERKLWEVLCTNGKHYDLRHRSTAEVILSYSPAFVQIHKRFIVNVSNVCKVVDGACVLQPPLDQVNELRISKNYRSEFMAAFYNI